MANTIISDLLRTDSVNTSGEGWIVFERENEPIYDGETRVETCWGNHSNKPHPLDRRYPHVCFECKKPLKFEELFRANIYLYNPKHIRRFDTIDFDMPLYRRLKKLWRSQVIEFFCCNCFKLQVTF